MESMLLKAIRFAKEHQGSITEDTLSELRNLVHCYYSEVENKNAIEHKDSKEFWDKSDFKAGVHALLSELLYVKQSYDHKIAMVVSYLK